MNIYKEVQSLQKSPIEVGGLCSIVHFKIEDVLTWPVIDPVTGTITTAIAMKPGTSMYFCQAADKGRSYHEELKYDTRGPFTETQITGTLGGNNTANILSLDAMKHHEWGLILKDRAGYYRLVGNQDAGARFTYEHSPGDSASSRKVNLKWDWQYPNAAPVYLSQAFTITIGGVTVTAGKLTLIMRFRVGYMDAFGNPPVMNNGDTVLTRAAFANKTLLVLADGTGLPVDDGSGAIDWTGSIARHIEKTLAGSSITYVGGVIHGETIEIYEFE